MPHKVIFTPEAAQDVQDAQDWYAEQRYGLDEEFEIELTFFIGLIAASPERFGFITEPFRRAPLKRFPYYIAYKVKLTEIVVVERVLHRKQESSF